MLFLFTAAGAVRLYIRSPVGVLVIQTRLGVSRDSTGVFPLLFVVSSVRIRQLPARAAAWTAAGTVRAELRDIQWIHTGTLCHGSFCYLHARLIHSSYFIIAVSNSEWSF